MLSKLPCASTHLNLHPVWHSFSSSLSLYRSYWSGLPKDRGLLANFGCVITLSQEKALNVRENGEPKERAMYTCVHNKQSSMLVSTQIYQLKSSRIVGPLTPWPLLPSVKHRMSSLLVSHPSQGKRGFCLRYRPVRRQRLTSVKHTQLC